MSTPVYACGAAWGTVWGGSLLWRLICQNHSEARAIAYMHHAMPIFSWASCHMDQFDQLVTKSSENHYCENESDLNHHSLGKSGKKNKIPTGGVILKSGSVTILIFLAQVSSLERERERDSPCSIFWTAKEASLFWLFSRRSLSGAASQLPVESSTPRESRNHQFHVGLAV